MTGKIWKTYQPVLLVFIIVSILVQSLRSFLSDHGFDPDFLLIANLLLLTLSLTAIYLQGKGLRSTNTHFFVRTVYMAMIIKMFACLVAVFLYIIFNASNINKTSIFTSMGIYFLYAAVEVTALIKSTGKNKNA